MDENNINEREFDEDDQEVENDFKSLRQIITTTMLDRYGERWIEKLEKAHLNSLSSGMVQITEKVLEKLKEGKINTEELKDLLKEFKKQDLNDELKKRGIPNDQIKVILNYALLSIFDKCRKAQQKELKSFGNRASRNLIDFTYPADLFAVIFAEWNNFKDIFHKDTQYWQHRSELLSRIRNPMAHNRDEVLEEYERQTAEGYCNEILTLIKAHKP
jgi:hypothetical protein